MHIRIVADEDKARDLVDRDKPLYRKVSLLASFDHPKGIAITR